jgi:Mg/Co/Ni transporter MgtE
MDFNTSPEHWTKFPLAVVIEKCKDLSYQQRREIVSYLSDDVKKQLLQERSQEQKTKTHALEMSKEEQICLALNTLVDSTK